MSASYTGRPIRAGIRPELWLWSTVVTGEFAIGLQTISQSYCSNV